MGWADKYRTMKVRTNAIPGRCEASTVPGAEGIGLCRTEHMFLRESVDAFREMIVRKQWKREKALEKILREQQKDFEAFMKR